MATGLAADVAIVSVGIQVNDDQCEIVFPMIATGSAPDTLDFCASAVRAFADTGLDDLKACLSEEVSIIGIQALGGIDGKIPFRENFTIGDKLGTRTGHPEPASVGAGIAFYFDPTDVSPGNKTAVSHNTIPGISEDDNDDKQLKDALIAAIETFLNHMIAGYTDPGGTGTIWKRVNKAVRDAAAEGIRIAVTAFVRKIVRSVRRRLYPEFRM